MQWNTRWALVPLMSLGLLSLGGSALASASPAQKPVTVFSVKDDGEMFKPQTLDKGNAIIKGIAERFRTEVLVETSKTPPAQDAERVKKLSKDEQDRYFSDLAIKRAKERKVDGVYILINRSPPNLQVKVASKTLPYFKQTDARELRDKLVAHFDKKNSDEGLVQGLEFVQAKLTENPPPAQASTSGSSASPAAENTGSGFFSGIWGYICIGVVVLLVIWLIIGLIRAFTAPAGGYGGAGGGPGYGYGGGGGGFFSGLMGGMFGAMAGMWLYNNVFGGGFHGPQAHAGPPSAGDPGAGSEPQDYSGAGGTWGDDAGGGDAGGGDAGGGGDWGGGGGDWGGGGGDFGGGGGGDW